MRTFVAGTTKIDVIAHISQEDLELDRLVLSRFERSAVAGPRPSRRPRNVRRDPPRPKRTEISETGAFATCSTSATRSRWHAEACADGFLASTR